jgi:hypothetical protein
MHLRWIFLLAVIGSMIFSANATKSVSAAAEGDYFGESICLPDVYLQIPKECLALGPSEKLTDWARKNITYPLVKPVFSRPTSDLNVAPETYLKISSDSTPLYDSLESAISRNESRTLDPGLKYLSMLQRIDREDGVYYQLRNGWWVEAGEAGAACCIYNGRFQGLLFSQNPRSNLGWIMDHIQARSGPGYAYPEIGGILAYETVVPVYDLLEADGTKWYMIGPDAWVERRWIRMLEIHRPTPEGVKNGRWIEVNLYEQTLAVFENNQLVFATLIASGQDPFFTRPGLFQIFKKKEVETMSGAFASDRSDYYYLEGVPWTMYYDEARALHGAYWRTMMGFPQSHGCVNLSIGDSAWLYQWAVEGDWVYVWDPSGATPIEEEAYTQGGA